MRKTLISAALGAALVGLGGCAMAPVSSEPSNLVSSRPAAASVNAGVDWKWEVSGDSAVRPMQVFSVHGKTYLQMRPQQAVPAVLVDGQPIPFEISSPYIVIQGSPARMDLVANGYRAIVAHEAAAPKAPAAVGVPDVSRVQRVSMAAMDATTTSAPTKPAVASGAAEPAKLERVSFVQSTPRAAPAAAAATSGVRVWRVVPREGTLSNALTQWARESGVQIQWRAPVDVPIVANGEFHGPFWMAMGHALDAASTVQWKFVMSLQGDAIVINAIQNS